MAYTELVVTVVHSHPYCIFRFFSNCVYVQKYCLVSQVSVTIKQSNQWLLQIMDSITGY